MSCDRNYVTVQQTIVALETIEETRDTELYMQEMEYLRFFAIDDSNTTFLRKNVRVNPTLLFAKASFHDTRQRFRHILTSFALICNAHPL